jgi:hypothetical protein
VRFGALSGGPRSRDQPRRGGNGDGGDACLLACPWMPSSILFTQASLLQAPPPQIQRHRPHLRPPCRSDRRFLLLLLLLVVLGSGSCIMASTACSTRPLTSQRTAAPRRCTTALAGRRYSFSFSSPLFPPYTGRVRPAKQQGGTQAGGRRLRAAAHSRKSPCLSLTASAARRGKAVAHHAGNGRAAARPSPMWGTRLSSLGSFALSTWQRTQGAIRRAGEEEEEGAGNEQEKERLWARKAVESYATG